VTFVTVFFLAFLQIFIRNVPSQPENREQIPVTDRVEVSDHGRRNSRAEDNRDGSGGGCAMVA
jgi:hypothetical protein